MGIDIQIGKKYIFRCHYNGIDAFRCGSVNNHSVYLFNRNRFIIPHLNKYIICTVIDLTFCKHTKTYAIVSDYE